MTVHNVQSFFRSRLQKPILAGDVVPFELYLSTLPSVANGYITVSPNSENEEIMEYSTINSATSSITVIARGINPSATPQASSTTYQFSHQPLDEVRGDLNHLHINERVWLDSNNTFVGAQIYNGDVECNAELNIPTFADTAARDVVYNSPVAGDKCVVEGIGEQTYFSGAWNTLASYSPNANTRAVSVATAVVGEVFRNTDDNSSLYYKDNDGETIKLVDVTSNKIPQASVDFAGANLTSYVSGASDTTAGLVERATDAEVLAGADTTRYVTPKQAKDNYGTMYTTSWTILSSVSWTNTLSFTHWLGRIPKFIRFHASVKNWSSTGTSNVSSQSCIYNWYNSGDNIWQSNTYIWYLSWAISWNSTTFTLTWADSTSATISYTKTWTWVSNVYLVEIE